MLQFELKQLVENNDTHHTRLGSRVSSIFKIMFLKNEISYHLLILLLLFC